MQTNDLNITDAARHILTQVRQVIQGKDQTMTWVLATILSGGHILLEDIPGVGKTSMAVAFSKTLGLSYNRVQFTPDVLPSDITGFTVLDQASGKMTYSPGAVLCNLFLADELNRATSRTQSALLEAMEENQVTVDGVSHSLPDPFIVIATQNPTGAAGTQLLPDSQMDRFAIRLSLGYPQVADEIAMVQARIGGNPMAKVQELMTPAHLKALQQEVAATHVSDAVIDYIVRLVDGTRHHEHILRGASPRATLCITDMSKAIARFSGRDYVIPRDVREVFLRCIPHRLLLSAKAESGGLSAQEILSDILDHTRAPLVQ